MSVLELQPCSWRGVEYSVGSSSLVEELVGKRFVTVKSML